MGRVAVDVAMQALVGGGETASERKAREARERRETRELLEEEVMLPFKDKPRELRSFAVFDIESKKGDTQKPGFERPFLACFFDGTEYHTFRNDPRHRGRSYKESFWHDPGGCIDKLCKLIFGIRPCKRCSIGEDDYRWGRCESCVEARRRYQKKEWILTAHNGGNFDNLFILGFVRRHRLLFDCEIINVQSRMLILSVRPRVKVEGKTKGEGWSFTDSVALMPLSLDELSKTFSKGDKKKEKMKLALATHEDDPRWEVYNRRDCEALHHGVNTFRALIEKLGGTIGVTAASTAMQLFRRKFQKVPILRSMHFDGCSGRCERSNCPIIDCRNAAPEERKCHGCAHDFVRDAFFGGRTEPIRFRGRRLKYHDLNSSYPFAMKHDMPIGKMREMEGGSLENLRAMSKKHIGFVECVIEIPGKCYLPPLPYRLHKKSGEMKLIFPVGRLYGTWSFLEIEAALRAGARILDVGKSVWYGKGKIFDKMIDTLYAYRQKVCKKCKEDVSEDRCKCRIKTWDAGLDFCSKLMMNSTFGKLGLNPVREMIVFPDTMDEIDESMSIPPPHLMSKHGAFPKQHVVKADYICPQIPAYITAFARMRLYEGALSVLKRRGKIYYMDTDSLISSLPVKPIGKALGDWKIEKRNVDIEILLPKMYLTREHEDDCIALGRTAFCKGCKSLHKKDGSCPGIEVCPGCKSPVAVAMKGVPRLIQNETTWNTIKKRGKKGRVYFDRPLKFRSMLNKGLDSPVEERTHKSVTSEYDKRSRFDARGKLLPEGNTLPLVIMDPPTVALAREARALREAPRTVGARIKKAA